MSLLSNYIKLGCWYGLLLFLVITVVVLAGFATHTESIFRFLWHISDVSNDKANGFMHIVQPPSGWRSWQGCSGVWWTGPTLTLALPGIPECRAIVFLGLTKPRFSTKPLWHDFWHHICRLLNASEVYQPLFSLVSPWCGCPDLLVSWVIVQSRYAWTVYIYVYIYIIILYIESLKIIHWYTTGFSAGSGSVNIWLR